MENEPSIHVVYKSLNKPLTIWGVDRRYFFIAVVMGGATFNMFLICPLKNPDRSGIPMSRIRPTTRAFRAISRRFL
jgi:hypothetical protein